MVEGFTVDDRGKFKYSGPVVGAWVYGRGNYLMFSIYAIVLMVLSLVFPMVGQTDIFVPPRSRPIRR